MPDPPPLKTLEQIKADARAFALSSSQQRTGRGPGRPPLRRRGPAGRPPGPLRRSLLAPTAGVPITGRSTIIRGGRSAAAAAGRGAGRGRVGRPPMTMHSMLAAAAAATVPPAPAAVPTSTATRLHAPLPPLPTTLPDLPMTADDNALDHDLDDYDLFVKSLGLLDVEEDALEGLVEEEDDEYDNVEEEEDDDDDDEDQALMLPPLSPTPTLLSSPTNNNNNNMADEAFDADFYQQLEQELGWLEEEDMQAAVATLVEHPKPAAATVTAKDAPATPATDPATTTAPDLTASSSSSPPPTPLRHAALNARIHVTDDQYTQLQHLLQQHYQLLWQQAVLATRAAGEQQHRPPEETRRVVSETAEELTEILDGAVGMLQDLEQHRKDAIRHYIQFHEVAPHVPAQRSLWAATLSPTAARRLTRAQFTKTLAQDNHVTTVFSLPGMSKMNGTFAMINQCVQGQRVIAPEHNIFMAETHAVACRHTLLHVGAPVDDKLLPGSRDLSENFLDAREFLGHDYRPPSNEQQVALMRRNRNFFTSAEDNLVLRGVNLYGEKQWILLADRFLPDRSVHIISQRYSKICEMIYRAHGVSIDSDGDLLPVPKHDSIDDIAPAIVAKLEPVEPPAVLNVHRWSLQEDLALLKIVPIMGNMWAEIAVRLFPHRDRGHLRKRYQVLERRIKNAVQRNNKSLLARKQAMRVSRGSVNHAAAILASARQQSPEQPLVLGVPDSSRAAVETLADGDTTQWSAKLQELLHDNTENMVASTLAMELSKSPSKMAAALADESTQDSFAGMNMNEDPSGFSMLKSAMSGTPSRAAWADSRASSKPAGSLFAGVVERTWQGPAARAQTKTERATQAVVPSQMKPPPPTVPAASMESPQKQNPSHSLLQAPMTPLQPSAPPMPGMTPIPLSEFMPDSGQKSTGGNFMSPSMQLSNLGASEFDASQLNRMFDDMPSPPPRPPALQLELASPPQGQQLPPTPPSAASTPNQASKPLFGHDATLLENDFEAITALNSLSHSPMASDSLPKRSSTAGQSLFSKVVGAKPVNKKRKLQF